jgi:K+-sensing histidine kinase KdpD
MPYELSKGNLSDGIKESKNRYFGRFIWGIGMLRDALESHKNKELKLARDKKMILLSISHDIKTPLNAINLYAKALEQGLYDTEEEKVEAVVKIQEKTTEINEFVKDIMKSTTEDVISIEVNNSEYYLTELINKIAAGYSERCRLSQMEFDIGSFENTLLKGDIERMYEAAGNLIENAFKYGDGKRISITFTEEDYCVLIHIFNSGIPVGDSELPHLFDSFYRGSNTEGKAGNGLGLYICSEIMKKMNGDIFARKCEDGMEFILVCPMS